MRLLFIKVCNYTHGALSDWIECGRTQSGVLPGCVFEVSRSVTPLFIFHCILSLINILLSLRVSATVKRACENCSCCSEKAYQLDITLSLLFRVSFNQILRCFFGLHYFPKKMFFLASKFWGFAAAASLLPCCRPLLLYVLPPEPGPAGSASPPLLPPRRG